MRLLCSLVLGVLLVTLTGAAAAAPNSPGHHDDQIQAPSVPPPHELALVSPDDPQAPVREDEVQVARHEGGKPHDDEIQAPW